MEVLPLGLSQVFLVKRVIILTFFEGNNKSFGSQQISPNGYFALSKLINSKLIEPYFEPFHNIHFKKLNSKQNIKFLSQYNLFNKTSNFWLHRKGNIINVFKKRNSKKISLLRFIIQR